MASERPEATSTIATSHDRPPDFIVDPAGVCMICNTYYTQTPSDGDDEYDGGGGEPFLALESGPMDPERSAATEKLLQQKKLVLVLDIDHTLVHTSHARRPGTPAAPGPETEQLYTLVGDRPTKLRPFVDEFLREAAARFDMYLYTKGSSTYAGRIAEILDPKAEYFKNKVISSSDFMDRGKKTLDLVLAGKHVVVILDDSPSVWSDDSLDNLVQVKKYFFPGFRDVNNDESKKKKKKKKDVGGGEKNKNTLWMLDQLLKRIHDGFFNGNCRDVRGLLRSERRMTLKGCGILISGALEPMEQAWGHVAAENMGASSWTTARPEVTHVLCCSAASNMDQDVMKWAEENRKHLVTGPWLDAAYYNWARPTEEDFSPV